MADQTAIKFERQVEIALQKHRADVEAETGWVVQDEDYMCDDCAGVEMHAFECPKHSGGDIGFHIDMTFSPDFQLAEEERAELENEFETEFPS